MVSTATRFIARALGGLAAAGALAAAPAAAQDMSNSGNVSLGAGIDFVNQYYFRGIVQETGGVIAQPFLEGSIALGGGAATITAGTWSSLHSVGDAGFTDAPQAFYETDFYAGVSLAAGPAVGIDLTYTAYMSPRGSWGTTKEFGLGVSYDMLLAPSATFVFEHSGGADGGPNRGNYLELGLEPAAPLGDAPVSLSFPIALGLSLGDYFEYEMTPGVIADSTFGFFSVGATLGIPLSGIPAAYGSWEAAVGISVLTFGDGLKAINDEDNAIVGLFGLSLGY